MANNELNRVAVLLKAACEMLKQGDLSAEAHYDGTDCDGHCLLEDAEIALHDLAAPAQAERSDALPKWIDDQKGKDPTIDALIEYIERIRGQQGGSDAARLELDRIKRVAACGTVDSFLALPDQDKRYWFAQCIDESERRKLAEERLAFLHSTNSDAQGWEWGVARVRRAADGRIEYLWGLSDSSDIDAAIQAQAGEGDIRG